MGGFENLPEITMWTYDDVARTLYKGDDINNTPGKSHQVSATIDLSDLKSTDNLRIIVMIVNNETGIVENAAMDTINSFTSVDTVESNSCCIAAKGAVKVAGLTTPAEVYSSDGSLRGIIQGDGELPVTPGIYIVKAGAYTWKVIVK